MYSVMIVEDEMLVRLGFKHSVSWEKYNMVVCADAANGQEAWEYYSKAATKPDLIITDLKMPLMDGMELIRRIRERDAQTRIVILSCLEDFDLVRQAMKMGVSNYILKLTMTDDEIDDVLSRVSEELGAQQRQESPTGIIRNPYSLKENIIKDYVFYGLYSEEEFIQHISRLKLQLQPERLVACMAEIDRYEEVQEKFKDEKGELIRVTILNVLNELLTGLGRGEAVSDNDKRYMLMFSFHDIMSESQIREELYRILTKIRKTLDRFFNITVTIGISGIRNEYRSLRTLYKESAAAVQQKYVLGAGTLIFHGESDPGRIRQLVLNKLRKLDEKWRTMNASGGSDFESIIQQFQAGEKSCRPYDVKHLFLRMLHSPSISAALNRIGAADLDAAYWEALQRCETLSDAADKFLEFLDEIADLQGRTKQLSKEIAYVVRYVREHFHQDILLQDIAERLEITPNYLSTLFKKEMKLAFSEYLNRVRLEHAKELLLTTNLKSYEIAERIGFSDDSYFSRAFKKYVGVRPNGFRRMWVNDQVI